MKRFLGLLLVIGLLVPGCISEEDFVEPTIPTVPIGLPSEKDPRLPASATSPRVVVAVIDSGVNFYHDWFQRKDTLSDDVLKELVDDKGLPPARFTPSRDGNWTERVEDDHDTLRALKSGQLYYFEGTNVFGISFQQTPEDEDQYLFLTGASHGTMTSGAVVEYNPNAIVIMAQGDRARAEAWVAARPWIDVVSMSYGPPGSTPREAYGFETSIHTETMADAGKVPVGAADNSPAAAPIDETAGPPWVIGVAGDNSTTRCRQHNSGTAPDFTSDFTQRLPRWNDTTNTTVGSGTSFATPKTASTFSRVIYDVRVTWEHKGGILDGALAKSADGKELSFASLRDAFNRTALYFDQSCQPQPGTNLPVAQTSPWAQQGWGHLGPEVVNATIDHVLGVKVAPE
ncbi:MAG TPA: S8/S53 family peptidase, partial [Candidatus Thermoplasmatota archaeon]